MRTKKSIELRSCGANWIFARRTLRFPRGALSWVLGFFIGRPSGAGTVHLKSKILSGNTVLGLGPDDPTVPLALSRLPLVPLSYSFLYSCMKATLEIPDELYAMVKARAALEGRTLRSVAIELFGQWVRGDAVVGGTSLGVEEGKPDYADAEQGLPRYNWAAIKEAIEGATGKTDLPQVSATARDITRAAMEAWARADEDDMRDLGKRSPGSKQ